MDDKEQADSGQDGQQANNFSADYVEAQAAHLESQVQADAAVAKPGRSSSR
jgi:hypothetical protein